MHQLCERMVGNRNGGEKAKETYKLEQLVIDHLWNHDTLNHSVIDNDRVGGWRTGRYSPAKNDGLVRRLRTDDLIYIMAKDSIGRCYAWNHNALSYSVIDNGTGTYIGCPTEVEGPRPNDGLTRVMTSHGSHHLVYYLSSFNRARKSRIVNDGMSTSRIILMPVRDSRVHSLLVSWIRRLPPTHPPPCYCTYICLHLESYCS